MEPEFIRNPLVKGSFGKLVLLPKYIDEAEWIVAHSIFMKLFIFRFNVLY